MNEQVAEQTAADQVSLNPGDLASLVDVKQPEFVDEAQTEQLAEPVATDDAETEAVKTEAVDTTQLPAVDESIFDPLVAELGTIDELKHDGFYEKIDESHIKELPTTARRILHNFRVAYKLKSNELDNKIEEEARRVVEREERLVRAERDFARRQAEFSSFVDDPKVKEVLKSPEGELPDLMSEEGIQARIDRGIAHGMQRVLEPMRSAATESQQEAAYFDFLHDHPEMGETVFKSEVVKLVRERKDSGLPVSTQDAYQLVKARRIVTEQHARAVQERRARAVSAKRVSRSSVSGSPGTEDIPSDVKRRGAASIAAWLKANPEAARRMRDSFQT